ncbi:E3 ubiquitin-protein ligase MARCHF2 isoform X6 [Rattus norvegicus]|uniref:E3 ubiquitin-protein ligase MARCHF2 isoform X6 n=1 Tax=Rattus norvegicus TaxID=10116 RepID=UPI002FD7FE53
MTTGDCCHLPGSLCDCSSSPAFSKVVEATGLGPPQYVAQVTSRDGRLLSTVIRALDTPRSYLCVPPVTVPSAESAMREQMGRTCCPHVAVLAPWELCTRAAWRNGCLPPTPATVSCVTLSLQWKSGPDLSQSG